MTHEFNHEPRPVVFVPGLGNHTLPQEMAVTGYMALRGIEVTRAPLDYYSGRSAPELRCDLRTKVEEGLSEHGRLAIVAASAAVSFGVSVLEIVRRENPGADLTVIGLDGWTRVPDVEQLIDTALHRRRKKPSEAFLMSALYCHMVAIPNLEDHDKRHRIRFYTSSGNKTVPEDVAGAGRIDQYKVRGRHRTSITRGVLAVPSALAEMDATMAACENCSPEV